MASQCVSSRRPSVLSGRFSSLSVKLRAQPLPRPACAKPSHPITIASLGTDNTHDERTSISATSRRDVLTSAASSAIFAAVFAFAPSQADAKTFDEGMSRYVRRKPLDSIDTYIPSVLLAKAQFVKIAAVLASEESVEEKAKRGQQLLRDGPAGSMRENMRAVARYASEQGGAGSKQDKISQDAVASFFRNIDTVDGTLFQAKRTGELNTKQTEAVQANLAAALLAIDTLVGLVPAEVVSKAQAVVQANVFNYEDESEQATAALEAYAESKMSAPDNPPTA
eukprot:CAMPEP_0198210318 /NCGR_PEP_ID=MMETSP1445-20131203/20032_1 /TAXON_ID=36898 /ORGANISM="Pyramimonas sp., Strain CCMP2087" /LENGTH=280 /DNA_ID=CAMNT_0043884351 /DNA_START=97 /DNA_END=935 /DNA_ORIENTATION=+